MEEGGVDIVLIPLMKKKVVVGHAKVSQIDAEALGKHNWHFDSGGYCTTSKNTTGQCLMHRMIYTLQNIPLSRTTYIDHINGDKTDNRRENLRTANAKQNSENKSKRKTKVSSQYIGVSYVRKAKMYHAAVRMSGKNKHLGSFATEEAAAKARDLYLVHLDNFEMYRYKLNFPDLIDDYKKKELPPYLTQEHAKKIYHVLSKNGGKIFQARIMYNEQIFLNYRNVDKYACAKAADDCIVENRLPLRLNFPENYPNYIPTRAVKTKCDIIDDTTVSLIITAKQGIKFLIDVEDYEKFKIFNMYISSDNYVCYLDDDLKQKRLHRVILNETDPNIYVDHIDGNTYNNKKSNLRRATFQENAQNRRKKENASSKYFGVSTKKARKYFDTTVINNDFRYTKSHRNEQDAARDRDLVILKLFPDAKFKMNFEWTPEEIAHWSVLLKNKYYQ